MKVLLDECVPRKLNLNNRNTAIIMIYSKSSQLIELLPRTSEILKAIDSIQSGQFVKIS